jgi:hypothetical protein
LSLFRTPAPSSPSFRKWSTTLPNGKPQWKASLLVVELGGPTMFARIGVMRALNRKIERVFNPNRKDHHWGRRKLVRDR